MYSRPCDPFIGSQFPLDPSSWLSQEPPGTHTNGSLNIWTGRKIYPVNTPFFQGWFDKHDVSMDSFCSVWTPMDLYGLLWTCMDFYGLFFASLPMWLHKKASSRPAESASLTWTLHAAPVLNSRSSCCAKYTLPKTNMDPENHWLVEENNLPGYQDVRVYVSWLGSVILWKYLLASKTILKWYLDQSGPYGLLFVKSFFLLVCNDLPHQHSCSDMRHFCQVDVANSFW